MGEDQSHQIHVRRCGLTNVFCIALIYAVCSGAAFGQTYPVRPIRSLVPFGPGGVSDIVARIVADKLSRSLKQQVVVDNRPSAGGIVATEIAVKAEPDGYTVLWFGSSTAISATLMKSLRYDVVRDLAPVSTTGYAALVLVNNPSSPARSVGELLTIARNDTSKFNIGITTPGGMVHMTAELFMSLTRLRLQVVPFRTTGALISGIRNNESQATFEFIAAVLPLIESGQLKALAVTSERRFTGLPNVPTVSESGVSGFEASAWTALAMPANTPRWIVERMNKEINRVVAMPDVKHRMQELGIEARGSTPEELRSLLKSDITKWKKIIESANIPRR